MTNATTKLLYFAFFLWSLNAVAATPCDYANLSTCAHDEVCVAVRSTQGECQKQHAGPWLQLTLPFHSARQVYCDQGNQSPAGNSHTYANSLYALDLHSRPGGKAATVFAGHAGRVIAHDGCALGDEPCGAAFGNHVKVLSDDGFLVLYAHLARVDVKTGDYVLPGQMLGLEGETGWAGDGNRHLHLSVHYDWRKYDFTTWTELGAMPQSVLFYLKICAAACGENCSSAAVPSTSIQCLRKDGVAPALCGPLN